MKLSHELFCEAFRWCEGLKWSETFPLSLIYWISVAPLVSQFGHILGKGSWEYPQCIIVLYKALKHCQRSWIRHNEQNLIFQSHILAPISSYQWKSKRVVKYRKMICRITVIWTTKEWCMCKVYKGIEFKEVEWN